MITPPGPKFTDKVTTKPFLQILILPKNHYYHPNPLYPINSNIWELSCNSSFGKVQQNPDWKPDSTSGILKYHLAIKIKKQANEF